MNNINSKFFDYFSLKNGKKINTKYVDVVDGIRAMAMIVIVAFHFWQQSWLQPEIKTPLLSIFGVDSIKTYYYFKSGYELVDLMIFISAFCLFLPHARAMFHGTKVDSPKTFYKKRAARILPSYYFCVFLLLIKNILDGAYPSTEYMWKDLLSHLTFTQMFDSYSYFSTLLNVVLWTMCIEVMFYAIFPFLAKLFRKIPVITYIVMVVISQLYIHYYVVPDKDLRFFVNSFPSFLGVFANGMMAAVIFVCLSNLLRRNNYLEIIFTIISVVSLIAIFKMMTEDLAIISDNNLANLWQMEKRYFMSFLFLVLVVSTALASKWYRFIFANPIAKFIAAISMNIYIWHQWLAVWLKYEVRIPDWTGATPPNQLGDHAWSTEYLLICILVSIIVAIAVTYLIEKPAAKYILNKKIKNKYISEALSVVIHFSICIFIGFQLLATCIKNEVTFKIWPFGKGIVFGNPASYFECVNILVIASVIITACIFFIKNKKTTIDFYNNN